MKLNSITLKIGLLLVLTLLLQLPSAMVLDIISERQSYQADVAEELTQSISGEQTIMGPVLVIPYQTNASTKPINEYILPKELKINGNLTTESLKRGIYHFQKYDSSSNFTGNFDVSIISKLKQSGKIIGTPYLTVGIQDPRGLNTVGEVMLNNQSFSFKPGTRLNSFTSGIHAPLAELNLTQKSNVDFSLSLNLTGTGRIAYVPIGENTTLQLEGNWPNPKFSGERSPATRSVTAKGFIATWNSSWFANNLNQIFLSEEANEATNNALVNTAYSFDTELIQTVDHYQLNERSVKYPILLIGMTFLIFFLFEVLKQLRVHPIQYALVGVALSVFYLLLLALSEQIGFKWAYVIASGVCVAQIGFYVSHILHSFKRGLSFSIFLSLIYAALYALLQSEDMALLIGSIGLFVVISSVMILTRRLNWYALGANMDAAQNKAPTPPTQ